MHIKPLAANLLLITGTIIAVLITMELVLQLATSLDEGPQDLLIHQKSSNDVLIYELKPNTKTELYTINSAGFRGKYRSETKPEGTYRIAILGDSVTFGLDIKDDEIFSARVERQLQQKGYNVEVLNFAVSGYKPEQEIEMLKTKALQYAPDLIVWVYALNDAVTYSGELLQFAGEEEYNKQFKHYGGRMWRGTETRSHYTLPFKSLKWFYDKLTISTFYHDIHFRHDGLWQQVANPILELTKLDQDVLFIVIPILSDYDQHYKLDEVHNKLRATVKPLSLAYYDLFYDLHPNAADLSLSRADHLHLNEQGHEIVANRLSSLITTKFLEKSSIKS